MVYSILTKVLHELDVVSDMVKLSTVSGSQYKIPYSDSSNEIRGN